VIDETKTDSKITDEKADEKEKDNSAKKSDDKKSSKGNGKRDWGPNKTGAQWEAERQAKRKEWLANFKKAFEKCGEDRVVFLKRTPISSKYLEKFLKEKADFKVDDKVFHDFDTLCRFANAV
jgi:hypothetical protein